MDKKEKKSKKGPLNDSRQEKSVNETEEAVQFAPEEMQTEDITGETVQQEDTSKILKLKFDTGKKKKSSFRYLKWIFLLLILLGMGAIFSPLCRLRSIVVLGNNDLKEDEIVSMGKIPMDTSIYLISKTKIEQNLKQNPYVRTARVSKKFPNRFIIDMNMREEVATVNFQEGFAVIDHMGFILRIEQDVTKIVKPLVTGLGSNSMLKVGDMLEQMEHSNFPMILDLISNAQNTGILHNISEMNLQQEDDIFLITTQGLRVLLGKGEDLTYKLNQLGQILVDLHTKGIRYGVIDMRYNSYPVYREK